MGTCWASIPWHGHSPVSPVKACALDWMFSLVPKHWATWSTLSCQHRGLEREEWRLRYVANPTDFFHYWLCGNDCFCLPTVTSHGVQALSKLPSPLACTSYQIASNFISCRDGWCPSQPQVPGSNQEYCQWSNAKILYPYKSLGLL